MRCKKILSCLLAFAVIFTLAPAAVIVPGAVAEAALVTSAVPKVFVSDNFETLDTDFWNVEPTMTVATMQVWSRVANAFSSMDALRYTYNAARTLRGVLFAGYDTYGDVSVETYINGSSSQNVHQGIIARAQNSNLYYSFMMVRNGFQLGRSGTCLIHADRSVSGANLMRLVVTDVPGGVNLKGYVNGVLVAETTDTSSERYASGKVGYLVMGNQNANFAQFRVTTAPLANAMAPACLADNSSATLSWEAVPGATGYNVYRATSAGGTLTKVTSTPLAADATEYTNSGLSAQSNYYYKMTFLDSEGIESEYSAEVAASTMIAKPNAPANLTATAVHGTAIELSWDAAANANTYKIYRANAIDGTFAQVGETNLTFLVDGDLASQTAYFYYVVAANRLFDSDKSATVNATTLAAGAPTYDIPSQQRNFTPEELALNAYSLYFVNAGSPNKSYEIAGTGTTTTFDQMTGTGEAMGLYQSKTDQAYGVDSTYGLSWGYTSDVATTRMDHFGMPTVASSTSVRVASSASTSAKVEYKFDLPADGYYYVTVKVAVLRNLSGTSASKTVNIHLQDKNVSGPISMSVDGSVTRTYKVYVYGGTLTVAAKPNAGASVAPEVSFINVRREASMAGFDTLFAALDTEMAKPEHKAQRLDGAKIYRDVTRDYYKNNKDTMAANAATIEGQTEIINQLTTLRTAIMYLKSPWSPVQTPTTFASFKTAQRMYDTDGYPIDAHGPGFMYDEKTETYYWYGEYHRQTYPAPAVSCYSSKDLYNWKYEGLAFQLIPSMDSFEDDPYFKNLYGDLSKEEQRLLWEGTPGEKANAGIRVGRILERPKVVYNEKTDKYVLWVHTEGYSDKDGNALSNYGRAEAGVAISDSPTGPFKWISSYRMDINPDGVPGHIDHEPYDKGFSRDMTLFVDDDEDKTAYLIYSSEENRTMYVSKLLPDYTDVASWHKNDPTADVLLAKHTRDEVYQGVYGEDYIRMWYTNMNEAPAIYKYDGYYYMQCSGSSGWNANAGRINYAPTMFGPWTTSSSNPFQTTGQQSGTINSASYSFNSQPNYVIPYDTENGKYIYVGDRWLFNNLGAGVSGVDTWEWRHSSDFSNDNATYVLLPINIQSYSSSRIYWYDEWNLDTFGTTTPVGGNSKDARIKPKMLSEDLPKTTPVSTVPQMPATIDILIDEKTIADAPVSSWTVGTSALAASQFATPGAIVTLRANLSGDYAGRYAECLVTVAPNNVQYFVNAGGNEHTGDYQYILSTLPGTVRNRGVADQAFTGNAKWGYIGTVNGELPAYNDGGDNGTIAYTGTGYYSSVSGSTQLNPTMATTVRLLDNGNANPDGGNNELSYVFSDLPEGTYTIYMGVTDSWAGFEAYSPRRATVHVNGGESVGNIQYGTSARTLSFKANVTDGTGLTLSIRNAATGSVTPDPMIGWIMIGADSYVERIRIETPQLSSKILEKLAANIPVKVTPVGFTPDEPITVTLHDEDGTVYGTAIADENGNALIKASAFPKAGTYTLAAASGQVSGTADLTVHAYNLSIWETEVLAAPDGINTMIVFGEKPVSKSGTFDGSITVKGGAPLTGVIADGNALVIPYAYAELTAGDTIVISGVRFPDLFPSYSFTFTATV